MQELGVIVQWTWRKWRATSVLPDTHAASQRAFDNTCYLTPTRTAREQDGLLARASECGLMKEIGPLLLACHRFVIGS